MNQNTPKDQSPNQGQNGPLCERCGTPRTGEGPCAACILEDAQQRSSSASHHTSGSRAAFEAPSIEALSAALPDYEIQVLIGQGGMGAVYRARHRKLDRMVAIKVLRPLELDDPVLAADFTERFEREARVLAKLDHPHIVRIYDFGRAKEPGAFFYLALEYIDGASLRQLMEEGRLSPKEVLELIPQVCDALQTAHSLGVIHRDIKPENILVDSEGRVRIADFGLAKLRDLEPEGMGLTQSHQTFGSVHYMAPEQMRSAGNVDHRADLYSLGVVVYEMLTGELPIGRFAAPSEKSGSGAGLDNVILRALENEPDERYQGADDLKDDLVAQDSAGSAPAIGVTPTLKSRRRRRRSAASHRSRKRDASIEGQEEPTSGRSLKREAAKAKDARIKSDATRSWIVVVFLALCYPMAWATFHPAQLFATGLEGDAFSLGFQGRALGIAAAGHQMSALGIPLWFGLLGLVIAATLRSMRPDGAWGDVRIPAGLGAFGTILIISTFLSIVGHGSGGGLRAPFFVVLIIYIVNSVMDFNSLVHDRVIKRVRTRH